MVRKFFVLLFSICVLCTFLTVSVSCGSSSGNSPIECWTGDEKYVSPKHTLASEAKNQSEGLEKGWWESTTFYHIWVRSFFDADGDGCGDLKGITQSLNYIYAVGFSGIWLSPIFECDFKGVDINMHGYDVSDYYAVNSLFGTEQDLIDLINACHDMDIKVIFDFVPNHSGKGNQWFKDSCANKDGKRDWYVWNSTALNWDTGMSLSGWTRNGDEYYWHAFADTQPDLNFRNYEVREEMKNVVRYWLNKGFDGLRIDAVRYLVENDSIQVDTSESIEFFKELRMELEKYDAPKFMTFEAWVTDDRNTLNKYFGSSSEPAANMLLDFDQGNGIISAINTSKPSALKKTLFTSAESNVGGGYGTFLANHDEYQARLGNLFEGDSAEDAKIGLATALSLLRPTTPFVYYGQEIAMDEDAPLNTGDVRLRMPFKWKEMVKQWSDDASICSMNRALIHFRSALPNLFSSSGKVKFLESKQQYDGGAVDKVAAYTISDGKEVLLCISNLSKYQWDSYSFSADATMKPDGKYTLVMAYEDNYNLSVGTESIVVKDLYPYETRLYYFGSTIPEPSMIFTESYLEKGEKFEGEDYLGEEVSAEKAFYLRGDMNVWNTSSPMGYDSSEKLWKAKVSLAGKTYIFKLDKGGEWKTSYGYDKKSMSSDVVTLDKDIKICVVVGEGTNLSFTAPSAGDYIFSFNEDTKVLRITRSAY